LLLVENDAPHISRDSLLAFLTYLENWADAPTDNGLLRTRLLPPEHLQTWRRCCDLSEPWRMANGAGRGRTYLAVKVCASVESRVWNVLDDQILSADVLRDVARFPHDTTGLCGGLHCLRYPRQACQLCRSVRTPLVLRAATTVYESASGPLGKLDWRDCAVLADMLEDAGCVNTDLLAHLRRPDDGDLYHVRGCWAVDAAVGKHRTSSYRPAKSDFPGE
jgi:hypothetical protein